MAQSLEELLKRLHDLGGDIENAVTQGVLQAGKKVQADAKRLTPVDTGLLRESITVRHEQDGADHLAVVGTVTNYAAFVELGTIKKPARPFLYPAFKQNESKVKDIIAGVIKKEIREMTSDD